MTNIAVILAGGLGKRFGEGLPKQLRKLEDGRTVLQTCIDAFRACPSIHEVLVVMHPDWIDQVQGVTVIAGGQERWQSSWNAIQHISSILNPQSSTLNVLIHDAARPFVSQRIIADVCHALETHEAVTVAVPATDTMYQIADGQIQSIPDRATMMRAQTPQAFRLAVIKRAFDLALTPSSKEPAKTISFTDDCGLVHQYMPDVPIYIVNGEEQNRKITFKEDICKQLF